ncbi:MAG: acetylornithine/succinylornithine family transaminase [Chloroflexi bacterium]|nr:acetylornithine/succinylornithine family transaminase [Chloroflexota bacterium]
MHTQQIIETESKYTSGVYSKRPAAIVRGQGARLWDSDGKPYIDCVGGQGSANVGHSNPAVVQAIAEQAARLMVATEVFYNDQRAMLEEKLVRVAPPQANVNRVFLCNSGAEANEGAIKFARYHTGRKEIVATMRGFHGRTFGALSATWEPKYREPFEPLVPGFKHIPYDNLDKAAQAIDKNTAAVILEIVQGEGGVRPGSKAFIEGITKLAHERGALVILDEIQTGFGRTGKMFAAEHYDIAPDLISVAKSIAGGLPMGAILISERIRKLEPQTHGSTFGGNPLVCAAANATIDYLREHQLPARAAELGEYALGRLKRIESPLIRDVRGSGLLLGVELKIKVTPVLQALMERGVLALPAGPNVLRLLPPLVIEKEDLDAAIDEIERVLQTFENVQSDKAAE